MNRLSNPIEIIERKDVRGGAELQIKSWTSDVIRPGRVGYQLALVRFGGGLTTQFPTDWENYTREDIWKMYNSISSVDEFNGLRERILLSSSCKKRDKR